MRPDRRESAHLAFKGQGNKEHTGFETGHWLRLSHPKHHEWAWSGKGWRSRTMTKVSKISEIIEN